MLIKQENKNVFGALVGKLVQFIKKRKLYKFALALILLLAFGLGCVYYGMILYRADKATSLRVAAQNIFLQPKALAQGIEYYLKGLFTKTDRIFIDIGKKNFQELMFERENALRGYRDFSFVPAVLTYENNQFDIKIRLKGDRIIHFEDKDQLSFRVQIKTEDTLFGMRIFSLQKPRARNYIYEWLFHQFLKEEDVLSLRYKFIQLTLNGQNLGTYALEEMPDVKLLEYNGRREGPIIAFSEDLGTADFSFRVNAIIPFSDEEKWTAPEYSQITQEAINLLESFRQNKLKISQVFDIKKLADFFAITDLLGTRHGALWKSIRFYYNPITSKLEPIGFDAHFGTELFKVFLLSEIGINPITSDDLYTDWFSMFFNNERSFDEEFYREYMKSLVKISESSYLDNIFDKLESDLERNLAIIFKDFPLPADHFSTFGPDLFYFNKDIIYQRQQYIREKLNPKSLPAQKGIQAYLLERDENKIVLGLFNVLTFPLEIKELSLEEKQNNRKTLLPSEKTIILPSQKLGAADDFLGYKKVVFNLSPDFILNDQNLKDLKIEYELLGTDQLYTDEVFSWSYFDNELFNSDIIRQRSNFKAFSFLNVDEATKTITVQPGKWNLAASLIIPEGYKVIAGAGVQINLMNEGKIISYSPFEFIGSLNQKIIISSEDFSGQGIVLIQTKGKSRFEYVSFEGLSNVSQPGWELTGAVTFYESDVNFQNCQFNNNQEGDDYLNIIRSEFSIDSCHFEKTVFDAFDADFSRGSIKKSSFKNSGNDGIDISGTLITLEDIFIEGAGDKGLSIGEKSNLRADGLEIIKSNIAIASKDMSELKISNINLSDIQIGLAVFQKKPEFGPSEMTVSGAKIENIEIPYMVEENSVLTVEGKTIKSNYQNVSDIIY